MRLLLAALLLFTTSSTAIACGVPIQSGPRPPMVSANTDYPETAGVVPASAIDNDETTWLWSDHTLTRASHTRVVATYKTTLSPFGLAFVEPDGIGGAWLAVGDPVEHVDAAGKSVVYAIPANIYDFAFAGDRAFFSDPGARRLGEFLPNGSVLYRTLRLNTSPGTIAADDDANVWFTDFRNRAIGVSTPDGREFFYHTTDFPARIVRGNDQDFWFVARGSIQASGKANGRTFFRWLGSVGHVTKAGVITEYPLSFYSSPTDIAISADNRIFVLESGSVIAHLDLHTGQLSERSYPPATIAFRLKLDAQGRVYAATQRGGMIAMAEF